jgi:hypothetical protein
LLSRAVFSTIIVFHFAFRMSFQRGGREMNAVSRETSLLFS